MELWGALIFFVFVVYYVAKIKGAVDADEIIRYLKLTRGTDNNLGYPSFTGFFQGKTYRLDVDTYLKRNLYQRFTSVEFPVNNPTGLSITIEVPRIHGHLHNRVPFVTKPDGTDEENLANMEEIRQKEMAVKEKTDIQTGDESFNKIFFVDGNNREAVASVLSQDITGQMMTLDGFVSNVGLRETKHYFDLYLNGDTLLFKRYGITLDGAFYEKVLTMMNSVAMAVEDLK